MKSIKADQIKRVVVRGANWLGDGAMTVPALRELRHLLPHAHLSLFARSTTAGLFTDANLVDEVVVSDRSGWLSLGNEIAEWKRGQFDLAILFPNSFQVALIAALASVPVRLGYAAQGRGFLLTHSLPAPEWRVSRHEVFYYLNIVSELERLLHGTSQMMEREPDVSLQVSDERQIEASEVLRRLGARDGRTLVALCPGSINSRAKRWPAERYAALADRLIDELDVEVLLTGSPGERDVSLQVANHMRHRPIMATGTTDLSSAIAMLSLVDLLVTNDTGPAHIASAMGRPTLVIFGPTNPLTTRPFSAVAEMIRQPPVCAPCMLRDCPIDHRCLTAISPDEVFQRAAALLGMSEKLKFVELVGPPGTSDKLDLVGHP
ncbi:MAG: lipopolysaccharide heptosyltransferase II [Pyrinomonadaceae bacterium]